MNKFVITDFMKTAYAEGQMTFIDRIKRNLYQRDSDIFEKIDYYNDDIYLEPLLYAYFSDLDNSFPLEQIISTYLKNTEPINVVSDRNGRICLPGNGFMHTSLADQKFSLFEAILTTATEDNIKYDFVPVHTIGDTGIELAAYEYPLLNRFYKNWETKGEPVVSIDKDCEMYDRFVSLITRAFEILRKCVPRYYEYCLNSTHKIVLFRNSVIPGFVTREAHGTIYLSVNDESNIAYFLDEIVHQCGHNIFNAITCRVSEFIQIDHRTMLRDIVGHDHITDTDIDGAFHGVFTVCTGLQVLNKVLNTVSLDKRNTHELIGRLGVKKRRFRSWSDDVNLKDIFTPKGKSLFNELDSGGEYVISSNPQYFKDLDFSDQPYTFSYEVFLQQNGI